jgi:hypothetical protein
MVCTQWLIGLIRRRASGLPDASSGLSGRRDGAVGRRRVIRPGACGLPSCSKVTSIVSNPLCFWATAASVEARWSAWVRSTLSVNSASSARGKSRLVRTTLISTLNTTPVAARKIHASSPRTRAKVPYVSFESLTIPVANVVLVEPPGRLTRPHASRHRASGRSTPVTSSTTRRTSCTGGRPGRRGRPTIAPRWRISPPQTPHGSRRSIARARHGSRTGHRAHIACALAMSTPSSEWNKRLYAPRGS